MKRSTALAAGALALGLLGLAGWKLSSRTAGAAAPASASATPLPAQAALQLQDSDLVTLLAESGIALRAGQHCAQPLLTALGVSGTLRASFAPYNTQDDVAALVHAVDRALEILVD